MASGTRLSAICPEAGRARGSADFAMGRAGRSAEGCYTGKTNATKSDLLALLFSR
jgi:hypothetical protein